MSSAASSRSLMIAAFVAATVALFSSVTMVTVFSDADGALTSAYGFPLPWHEWCGYTSMRRTVDPVAAGIDLVVYGAAVAGVALLARGRVRRLLQRRPVLVVPLAMSATVTVLLLLLSFIGGVDLESIRRDRPDDVRVVERDGHAGWDFVAGWRR